MGPVAVGVAVAFAVTAATALPSRAAPIEITWSDLVPASAIVGDKVRQLTGTVQHNQVTNDAENAANAKTTTVEEMLGISSGVAFRKDLDNKEVKLSGFILPLAFNGTKVTQLLLVPFVGACIHVPPPPANQLVLVEVPQGYASSGLWEPISVTGTLSVSGVSTELAQVGYAMKASAVVAAK
ncbi:MAG: DUF3299 domain-containing protein [Bauldia sp.]